MLTVPVFTLAGTHAVAAAIAGLARAGDVVVLSGEMGAGKTAFAQGFGAALGVTDPVTSPTYTLVHSYEIGRLTLHHADLYRLDTHHQVADLALAELVEDRGILLVEWGDAVASSFGDHLHVRLEHPDRPSDGSVDASIGDLIDETDQMNASRIITLTLVGRSWSARRSVVGSAIADIQH